MSDPQQASWPGQLRAATDADAAGVGRLIGDCFAEYDGCVLDPNGIDTWMAAPASSYAAKGGQFWVLDERPGEAATVPGSGKTERPGEAATVPGSGKTDSDGARLAACVGWAADGPDRMELKNLYVSARARRQGLGRRLAALVEAVARERGADALVLWSDTRFQDAHRLYEGLGYQRTGEQRALHDPSNSIEYGFVKTLGEGAVRRVGHTT